jgi:anti-anti-sigma factor
VRGREFGDLEIEAVLAPAGAIVAVRGEVDDLTAPTLTGVLAALAGERPVGLTLDLAGCTFMGAAGLRTIVQTLNLLTRSGGALTVRDASSQVLRILDITGVDEQIHLESSIGAALRPEPRSADLAASIDLGGSEIASQLAHTTSAAAVSGVADAALALLAALASATVVGADGASVTLLRDGRFLTVASTDETILRMDGHQYETGQGPCLDAATEGTWFQTDSLAAESRWPAFSPRAMEEGIASILSTPLIGADGPRGALNIYSRRDAAFAERQRERAGTYASQASGILATAEREITDEQLEDRIAGSLAGRQTIARAEGIIMARRHVSEDLAAGMLLRAARTGEVTVLECATEMISSTAGAELIG